MTSPGRDSTQPYPGPGIPYAFPWDRPCMQVGIRAPSVQFTMESPSMP